MSNLKAQLLCCLLFSSFTILHAQALLNGSFEETTAPVGCNYNLSNVVFNSYYTNVEAYGGGNETDIIMDGCYVDDLPDGLRSISIAHVPEDEVSIEIDMPLTMGETYTLSFWALGETTFTGTGDIEIGASVSSSAFGVLIHTATPTVMEWGFHSFSFVAPNNATHITVKNAPGGAYWNHLDHFVLDSPEEELEVEPTHVSCFGVCNGSAEVIDGDLGPYTYQWDAGAGGGTDAIAADLCPGTYTVEVTNASGVMEVLEVTIEEPEEMIAAVVSLTPATCFEFADGAFTIEATGGTGELTYDIGGGPVDSGEFIDLAAGVYTVTITDENDCELLIDVEITQPEVLVISEVVSIDLLCNGVSDGLIEVEAMGGTAPYSFNMDGGAFTAETVYADLAAGDYVFGVIDENGCEGFIEITLNQPDAIIVEETISHETCEGDCTGVIELEATGGTGAFTYSIDGCATSDDMGFYEALCADGYEICIEDENGCQYTNTVLLEPGASEGDPTIVPFGPLCLNDDPHVLDAAEIGTFSGPGVAGGVFNPAVAGIGTHTIYNTLSEGCGSEATFEITVNPLPVVSFTVDENSGCNEPLAVSFTNTGDIGINCTWNFGDGALASSCGAVSHVYDVAGTFDVSLTVEDVNGCAATAVYSDYIDVYALPTANFTFSPNAPSTLDTQVDFTDLSTNAVAWEWQFDSFDSSTDQHPSIIFPPTTGTYQVRLVAFSEEGCSDTIYKPVIVNQEQLIFVPNAITPDGDLFNEVFKPYFTGIDIYDYHLTIYNRWGEIIFESYNLATGWNGTYGGEIVKEGVYVWHIVTADSATDNKLEFHGHVTVIK